MPIGAHTVPGGNGGVDRHTGSMREPTPPRRRRSLVVAAFLAAVVGAGLTGGIAVAVDAAVDPTADLDDTGRAALAHARARNGEARFFAVRWQGARYELSFFDGDETVQFGGLCPDTDSLIYTESGEPPGAGAERLGDHWFRGTYCQPGGI